MRNEELLLSEIIGFDKEDKNLNFTSYKQAYIERLGNKEWDKSISKLSYIYENEEVFSDVTSSGKLQLAGVTNRANCFIRAEKIYAPRDKYKRCRATHYLYSEAKKFYDKLLSDYKKIKDEVEFTAKIPDALRDTRFSKWLLFINQIESRLDKTRNALETLKKLDAEATKFRKDDCNAVKNVKYLKDVRKKSVACAMFSWKYCNKHPRVCITHYKVPTWDRRGTKWFNKVQRAFKDVCEHALDTHTYWKKVFDETLWSKLKTALLSPARLLVLLFLRFNLLGLSTLLDNMMKTEIHIREGIKKIWKRFGGNRSVFEKVVKKGAKKKALFNREISFDGVDDEDFFRTYTGMWQEFSASKNPLIKKLFKETESSFDAGKTDTYLKILISAGRSLDCTVNSCVNEPYMKTAKDISHTFLKVIDAYKQLESVKKTINSLNNQFTTQIQQDKINNETLDDIKGNPEKLKDLSQKGNNFKGVQWISGVPNVVTGITAGVLAVGGVLIAFSKDIFGKEIV